MNYIHIEVHYIYIYLHFTDGILTFSYASFVSCVDRHLYM